MLYDLKGLRVSVIFWPNHKLKNYNAMSKIFIGHVTRVLLWGPNFLWHFLENIHAKFRHIEKKAF